MLGAMKLSWITDFILRRLALFFIGGGQSAATPGSPAQSAPGSAQTPVTASATGAASAATATLPGVAGKTTYITGFQVTGGGATAGSIVVVTVTGILGGTMSYDVAPPTGAAVGMQPLIVTFPIPIPASAVNTPIAVVVPSLGAGNTNSAVAAQGFQQ